MYTFCYKVLSPRRQIPNRLSVFSVINCRYSVFFGIVNTDVGVGIGISKYRISVRYFGIPTQDYSFTWPNLCLRIVILFPAVVKAVLWSRGRGVGSPDEARLEQTPYHSNPTNLALFRRKITLYRFNQGAHTIAGGGSNGSRGLSPLPPITLTTGFRHL